MLNHSFDNCCLQFSDICWRSFEIFCIYLCDHPTDVTGVGRQKHGVGLFGEVGERRHVLFGDAQRRCSTSVLSRENKPKLWFPKQAGMVSDPFYKSAFIPLQPEPLTADGWPWIWPPLWLTQLGPRLEKTQHVR